jgi:Arc/MetJ-type ribon-helix-helix transcriptional regulator
MADDETLTLTLPDNLTREVRRAVEQGGYDGPDDVVAAALRVWIERGSPPAMTAVRLRELVEETDKSGEEDGDFDIEELLAEIHGSERT